MYFLNLSLLQFLAVFGSISAISVALYLLDRSRRKQVVSTLRFWVAAEQPAVAARRRRIQQPWSLLLQLVSMALLLLAIAQLRLGTPAQAGRDHVIVLDTSAWMAARSGNRTLMDVARDRARHISRPCPRATASCWCAPTAGHSGHRLRSRPQENRGRHHRLAARLHGAQSRSGAGLRAPHSGAGRPPRRRDRLHRPGRTAPRDPGTAALPRNLRVISIPDNVENVGLRKVGMRRSGADSELWEIYVAVRNYGARPRTVTLSLDFGPPGPAGRVAAGSRPLTLAAGAESEARFEYRTSAAGMLGVHLSPHDSFPTTTTPNSNCPRSRPCR